MDEGDEKNGYRAKESLRKEGRNKRVGYVDFQHPSLFFSTIHPSLFLSLFLYVLYTQVRRYRGLRIRDIFDSQLVNVMDFYFYCPYIFGLHLNLKTM